MCSSAHAGMAISAPAGLLELQAITASPSRRSAAGELGRRTTLPVGRHHTCSSCLEHPHTRIAGTSQFMLSITSERVKSPIERRDRRRSPDPRSLPSPLWAGVSTRSKTPQRWSPRRRATATEVPDPHRDLRCTSVADRWASSSRDPPRSPGPMAADPGPRGGGPPYDSRLRRLPGHAWRDPHLAGDHGRRPPARTAIGIPWGGSAEGQGPRLPSRARAPSIRAPSRPHETWREHLRTRWRLTAGGWSWPREQAALLLANLASRRRWGSRRRVPANAAPTHGAARIGGADGRGASGGLGVTRAAGIPPGGLVPPIDVAVARPACA